MNIISHSLVINELSYKEYQIPIPAVNPRRNNYKSYYNLYSIFTSDSYYFLNDVIFLAYLKLERGLRVLQVLI